MEYVHAWRGRHKNWTQISSEAKEKTEWTCQECGLIWSYDQMFALVTHHKDHNKWNNHPSNLKVLCTECHGVAHTKKR